VLPEEVEPVFVAQESTTTSEFKIVMVRDLEKFGSTLLLMVKVTSFVPVQKITVFGLHFVDSVVGIPEI
jgi:hypothetical protein